MLQQKMTLLKAEFTVRSNMQSKLECKGTAFQCLKCKPAHNCQCEDQVPQQTTITIALKRRVGPSELLKCRTITCLLREDAILRGQKNHAFKSKTIVQPCPTSELPLTLLLIPEQLDLLLCFLLLLGRGRWQGNAFAAPPAGP